MKFCHDVKIYLGIKSEPLRTIGNKYFLSYNQSCDQVFNSSILCITFDLAIEFPYKMDRMLILTYRLLGKWYSPGGRNILKVIANKRNF